MMDATQMPVLPRVALLGEFSAGKSTLVNVLLKGAHSPVRVTATQLPPIWYSYGDAAPVHIARDGTETELSDGDLSAAPLDDTRAIRVQVQSDILKTCELIDMPGSSDPNMTPDIWDAMLPLANAIVWCTPSTQAWRQSEAAIWEEIPEALYARSLLLLTRFDKIRGAEDRKRLLARVNKETRGLFRGVFPVSLIQALEIDTEPFAWRDSGMSDIAAELRAVLAEISGVAAPPQAEIVPMPSGDSGGAGGGEAASAAGRPAVMPRRVSSMSGRGTRPRRASREGSLI